MELHPLCTFFPRMPDEEFNSLKESLQTNGQTHPIYTLDGMILDGGNRYRALCELGIEPKMIEYQGPSPTQFILSSNLHRRHLTQGQSAAIVSASQSWINAQPEATQAPNHAQLDTTAARAKQSGVGQKTQKLADKLVKEAPDDLVKAVINGKKSLNKAIKEITPPKPVVPKQTAVILDSKVEVNQENLSNDSESLSNVVDQPRVLNSLTSDHCGESEPNVHNDTGAAPVDDITRLTELNRALNARILELTQEKDEADKHAHYWKEQYLTLEASLKKELAQ